MGSLWATWKVSQVPPDNVREAMPLNGGLRPINATLAHVYGDQGFDPDTYHLALPLPPAVFRNAPIAAIPLALIDHTEDEYDGLIESRRFEKIQQQRRIFVLNNIEPTHIQKLGGWQFAPWADVLVFGESVRLRSYTFTGLRSDSPPEPAHDPAAYSCELGGYSRSGPRNIWPKIFLPDLSRRSASIQMRQRNEEIADAEALLVWAATRGIGHGSTLVVPDAEYMLSLSGLPLEAGGDVKLTIKPAAREPVLVGRVRGPNFDFEFLFELFGRDMNVGVHGAFVQRRLRAEGDREALRRFLRQAALERPRQKLPVPVRLPAMKTPKRKR